MIVAYFVCVKSINTVCFRMESLTDNDTDMVNETQTIREKETPKAIDIKTMIQEAVKTALAEKESQNTRKRKIKPVEEETDSETESEEDEASEAEEVQQLTDTEEDYGPDINEKVAQYINIKLTTRVNKAKMTQKLDRQKRPQNLKYGQETKINTPIYKKLSKRARLFDSNLMTMQKLCVKSVIASSKTATKVIEMMGSENPEIQGLAKDIYDDVFDSITFAAQASFSINMKRVS